MKSNKYQKINVFCDCLECKYNDHNKDYTCILNEIYLDKNNKCINKEQRK